MNSFCYHFNNLIDVKIDIVDIHENFTQNTDALGSDVLHPSSGCWNFGANIQRFIE